MDERLALAQRLARTILDWHRLHGLEHLKGKTNVFSRYKRVLRSFQALSLSRPSSLVRLAREQLGGVFEHFYGQVLPEPMLGRLREGWRHEHSLPRTLSDAARLIIKLVDGYAADKRHYAPTPRSIRKLMEATRHGPVQVAFDDRQTPTEVYRHYFSVLLEREQLGLGGCNLLVALNEDLREGKAVIEDGVIRLFGPPSFKLEVLDDEEALPNRVLSGVVRIQDVVLGCPPESSDGKQLQG